MRNVGSSVGCGGCNHRNDVVVVQELLLENWGLLVPLRPLTVTGCLDSQTITGILEFQRRALQISAPTGRVDPDSPTLFALNRVSAAPHHSGPNLRQLADLESALGALKSEAANFGARFIRDAAVRRGYIQETERMAAAIMAEVRAGRLSPAQAAQDANALRNSILDAARLNSSDIGRAQAEALKRTGKTLQELEELYAQRLFRRGFSTLGQAEKNRVWLSIVESSGRSRPSVNLQSARLAKVGRGLIFVTAAFAVYNIATADDPVRQSAKEGVTLGAGIAGGAAGGAAAGLLCGPGAPVCVAVGVFVGGALGALGADLTFDWLVP